MSPDDNLSKNHYLGWRQLRQQEKARQARLHAWVRLLKLLSVVVPVLIVGMVVWYLQNPLGPSINEEVVPGEQETEQGEMATEIHLEQFDGKRTLWTLDSPTAERQERSIIVESPKLVMFRENGEQIDLTALWGTIDKESRVMKFEGEVVAEGDLQFGRLTTEWLQFDPKRGILYTDQPFTLENRDTLMEGIELQLFQERRMVHVLRNVKMVFYNGVPTMVTE